MLPLYCVGALNGEPGCCIADTDRVFPAKLTLLPLSKMILPPFTFTCGELNVILDDCTFRSEILRLDLSAFIYTVCRAFKSMDCPFNGTHLLCYIYYL